ncbi:hypothetical protein FNF28_04036 [Cafeteria roenbergensis]|uniref:Nucleotide exchange factor SIL1 n=1 Tax=Cafeteria roenbergensis TaxID=33653 RepID=A0A5A8DIB3_CAFRO|nr:hypothetical protein FNF28_04036 [Cafeteria roenbergensis]
MAPLAVLLGALLILHVASEAVQPNAAAVRAAAGSGALVAVDSPTDAASAASPASSLKVSEGLDFTPTHEWQEVPKGAHIPAGLDVRMDMENGKSFARLIPGSRAERDALKARAASLERAALSSLGAVDDADAAESQGGSADSHRHPAADSATAAAAAEVAAADGLAPEEGLPPSPASQRTRLDSMRRILQSLPEPEPDLASALQRGLSTEEVDALVSRVWERRQALLRKLAASTRTEAQQIQEILDLTAKPDVDHDRLAAALTDLEYHVSSAHNAADFRNMGGFTAIVPLLNSTSASVRSAAAWAVGSAVKYSPESQRAAAALGAHIRLAGMLARAADVAVGMESACPDLSGACARAQLEPSARAAYALGAMARGAPADVAVGLVRAGAMDAAARAASTLSQLAARLDALPDAAGTARMVALKSQAALSDVFTAIKEAAAPVEAAPAASGGADHAAAANGAAAASGGEEAASNAETEADGGVRVHRQQAGPKAEAAPAPPSPEAVAAAAGVLGELLGRMRQGPLCASALHVLAAAGAEGHEGVRASMMRRAVEAAAALPPACSVVFAKARGLPEGREEDLLTAASLALQAHNRGLQERIRGGLEAGEDALAEGGEDAALDVLAASAAASDASAEGELVLGVLHHVQAGLSAVQAKR